MPLRNGQPVSFYPLGLADSVDQTSAFPGACQSLSNSVFDRQNRGAVVARPGVVQQTAFASFTTAGAVSVAVTVGSRIYGMLATARNATFDEPFCWDTSTNAFVTISGVLPSNVPTTQSTSGAWTPPTMDVVGTKILVTHPGFSGSNYFGWFDTAGFSSTPTATTAVGSNTLTAVSSTTGVLNGMAISGAGIPANTVVVSTTANTIVMSNNATAAATVTVTITGGTQASPAWGAGNTTVNALPSRPTWVIQFFNRAYFGISNAVYFTDSLSALTISNANFAGVLTLGDTSATLGASGLAFSTSSAGILSSLAVFKSNSIYQISGDITGTGNTALSLNIISANIGCTAPRTAVSTPSGIYFLASDGPRVIDLRGQLEYLQRDESPTPDVVIPFTNATTPSRACASYTNGIYRVCFDTIAQGQAITGADYWYDSIFGRWNGPHTFAYSLAVPVGNSFYLASTTTVGLFKSDVTGSSSSVYTDNGAGYVSVVQSDTAIIPSEMSESTIIESTVELGTSGAGSSYSVIATDDSGNILSQVSVGKSATQAVYGTAVFGTAVYATATLSNHVTTIPWDKPLVFKKLVFIVRGPASSGYSVREAKHRFQKLGYVNA